MEMRYCTQCQRTKPVTDKSHWIVNKTRRWQCEWCLDRVKKPEDVCRSLSQSRYRLSQSGQLR